MDVTFRKTYDGEIVAVFGRVWSRHGSSLMCYAHVGQHGPIDLEFYRDCTKPATPGEYANLLEELTKGAGYEDLRVVKRLPISQIFRFRDLS